MLYTNEVDISSDYAPCNSVLPSRATLHCWPPPSTRLQCDFSNSSIFEVSYLENICISTIHGLK